MNRIMVSDSVNPFCPLADDFGLLIEEAEIASRPHEADRFRDAQCFPHWPALQRIDAAGWESGKREVDGHVQPPLPVSPPKNVGQLAFEVFEAADKQSRADGGQCLFDESDDAPTIADLIDEARAAFDDDAAVIGEELSSCGWSATEARHRGRLYGLRRMLAELEADEPGEVEAVTVRSSPPAKPTPKVAKPQADTMPADLLQPGGFLERMADWTLSQSVKRQPEFALAGAIVALATLAGRKVEDKRGTRTNIYFVAVGESGVGKEIARDCIKRLFSAAGVSRMLTEGASSGPAVLSAVRKDPSKLMISDEFGMVLASLTEHGASPWLKSVVTNLLRLFTSSGSSFVGESRADAKHEAVEPIDQPNLSVYGTTTATTLFVAIDESAISNGLLPRCLFTFGDNNANLDLGFEKAAPPKDLIDEAVYWRDYVAIDGDFSRIASHPRVLAMTPEADEQFVRWVYARDDEAKGMEGWRRTLFVRIGELAAKLALIHAISLNREARTIGVPSVDWGCRLAGFLINRFANVAETKIASSGHERQLLEVVEYIRSKDVAGATASEIARRFRKLNSRERTDTITHAIQACLVTHDTRPSKSGPPSLVYRAV